MGRESDPLLRLDEGGVACSERFDDVYFSREGGLEETRAVFFASNGLPEAWAGASETFRIGELGFGTGLNFLATAGLWAKQRGPGRLEYFSCERFPLSREELARCLSAWPELSPWRERLLEAYPESPQGVWRWEPEGARLALHVVFGDVAAALRGYSPEIHAWYLDGFDPKKNPEMWSDEVFARLASRSAPGATFGTFTAAGEVRRGLQRAGFEVEKVKGFGKKREMLRGRLVGPRAQG